MVALDLEDLDLDSDPFASFISKGNIRRKKEIKTCFYFWLFPELLTYIQRKRLNS